MATADDNLTGMPAQHVRSIHRMSKGDATITRGIAALRAKPTPRLQKLRFWCARLRSVTRCVTKAEAGLLERAGRRPNGIAAGALWSEAARRGRNRTSVPWSPGLASATHPVHLAQGRRRAPSDVITQRQHNQEPIFREKMFLQVIFGICAYIGCFFLFKLKIIYSRMWLTTSPNRTHKFHMTARMADAATGQRGNGPMRNEQHLHVLILS